MRRVERFQDIFSGEKDSKSVSLDAFNKMIENSELSASISEKGTQNEWPRILEEIAFGDCPNKKRQHEAENIIKEYAQKVAALILNQVQTLSSSEKPRKIVLCGGLSQAYTGFTIKNILKKTLQNWGITLILPRRRIALPLLGAAVLHTSEDSDLTLAIDIGRILVKKALFRSKVGILRDYIPFPSSPGFQRKKSISSQFILQEIIRTVKDVKEQFRNPMALSLAVGGESKEPKLPQFSCRNEELKSVIPSLLKEEGIQFSSCSITGDAEAAAALYGSESEKILLVLLGYDIKGGFPNRHVLIEHKIEGLDGYE